MTNCKIINFDKVEGVPEMVSKNLRNWCESENIGDDCNDFDKNTTINECIIDNLNVEISEMTKEGYTDELKKKIKEQKKTYLQLINFKKNINSNTIKRDLQLLQESNKNKIFSIIFYVIVSITYFCFAIYLVFNYFVLQKN